MIKRFLRLLVYGVLGGLAIFGVILLVLELYYGGEMDFHLWGLTRKGVGAAWIGMAATMPALVSEYRKVPANLVNWAHAGISLVLISLIVPITGWLPRFIDARFFVMGVFAVLILALLIWYFSAIYSHGTARKINERLQSGVGKDVNYRDQMRESYFYEAERTQGKYNKWSTHADKSDIFLYGDSRRKLGQLMRKRKDPEVNVLTVRVGIALLILFALFFVVMGMLPAEYFEIQ